MNIPINNAKIPNPEKINNIFAGLPLLNRINQAGNRKSFALNSVPIPTPSGKSILQQTSMDFNTFANKIVNGFNDKRVKLLESDVRGALNQADLLESASSF